MATKKAVSVEAKVVEKVEPEASAVPEAAVNPAIDPNRSAQERLDSLSEQQAKMRQDQVENPDYPVKENP